MLPIMKSRMKRAQAEIKFRQQQVQALRWELDHYW